MHFRCFRDGWNILRMIAPGLLLAAAAHAGPNAGAALRLDAAPAGAATDSLASLAPGATLTLAVRVSGAAGLDGFAFRVAFDTTRLAFAGAAPADPGLAPVPFLESRGGRTAAFLALRDRPGEVAVAATLAGADSARSPDGEGILAFLTFRALAPGQATLSLSGASLLDWRRAVDADLPTTGASLAIEGPTAARSLRPPSPGSLRVERLRDLRGRRLPAEGCAVPCFARP